MTDIPPAAAMIGIIQGFWLGRSVCVAAELGIPDLVAGGARDADALAQATGAHAPSLYRLLRALASAGIFSEDEQQRFSMTPLAATLVSDAPGSLRSFVISELGGDHYPAWGALLHSVTTGKVAFHKVYGTDPWTHRASHPRDAQIFDQAMSDFGGVVIEAVVASYDFSRFGNVVDVGGGDGSLLAHVLQTCPKTRGTVQDLPHVAVRAKARFQSQGLADRADVVPMSFLEGVVEGGDAYVMKWIIHDWNDRDSTRILRNCHAAMRGDARLLLIEAIVPGPNQPALSKFMDLNMMVMLGGRERTEPEYRALLEGAGFRLKGITPTHTEMRVIEAVGA
jgi:O-methyltransferase domain/Dimerisation domain